MNGRLTGWRGWLARDRVVAAALLVLSFAVYIADERWIGCGDTAATLLLARSIAFDGDVALDEFFVGQPDPLPYYARRQGTHVYSWFPLGSALLAVPAFAGARALGVSAGPALDAQVELLTASWVAAACVAVAYLLMRRLASRGWALTLALLFAFATPNWSTSSMNLWQHGPGTLAIELGVLALLYAAPASALLAGSALGFAVLVRPLDAALAGAIAIHLLGRDRRSFVAYVAGALPWAAIQLSYGYATFGALLGGYVHAEDTGMWQGPIVEAALAHCVSPNRGLFVSSPFLALGLLGIPALRRRIGGLTEAWVVAACVQLAAISAYASWWGGWCFGPRYMTELVPLLLGLASLERPLFTSGSGRAGIMALGIFSIGFHGIGVRSEAARAWNALPSIDVFTRRVWDVHDSQVLAFRRYQFHGPVDRVPIAWLGHDVGIEAWPEELPSDPRRPAPAAREWGGHDPRELLRVVSGGNPGWLVSDTSFELPAGDFRITFDVAGEADPVLTSLGRAEILAAKSRRVLAEREFTPAALGQGAMVVRLRLARDTRIEPRLWWNGCVRARVYLRSVTFDRVPSRA